MLARILTGAGTGGSASAAAKAADQSVTSSTVLVDEATLQATIGANENWVFTWSLSATFAAAGGIRIAVVTPSGATQLITASLVPDGILPGFQTTTTSGAAMAFAVTLGTAGFITVVATVLNGATAGTVKLQFAQAVSSLTATTVKASSSVVARKI